MEKGYKIDVLDRGYVRLIDWLGSDKRIVETARISYGSPSKGEEQDKKLLQYLWKHRHTSPFEHCVIEFNIKLPLFVQAQLIRHRTFRTNQLSARYSEMAPEFYIPSEWRKQDDKNKQGSMSEAGWNPEWIATNYGKVNATNATQALEMSCKYCYDTYMTMLHKGIAKEMARMVLPVNLYTEIYINCDLHNLLHFFELRMNSHSQYEMQKYACAMYDITKALFPVTIDAYDKFKFGLME